MYSTEFKRGAVCCGTSGGTVAAAAGHMANGSGRGGRFYQTVCVEGSGLALSSRHQQSEFFFFVCCHPERSDIQKPADIRQMVKPCLLSVFRVVHTCCQIVFQIQPE